MKALSQYCISSVSRWVPDLAVVAIYFLGAKLGLCLAFKHSSISPVWPPTGIAISALLLLGTNRWPAILVAAFLANDSFTPAGALVSCGIAIGNTLEAVVGASLIRRLSPRQDYFSSWEGVARFLFFGCAISTAVSASIGTLSLHLGGSLAWRDVPPLWFTWWIGDAGGALVVVPWVFSLAAAVRYRWNYWKVAEAIALVGTSLLACHLTFGTPSLPIAFLHIPVFIWAAVRFSQWGAATLVIIVSAFAIKDALGGSGQFKVSDPNESFLLLQIFIIASAATAQLLAALVNERKEHIAKLMRGERPPGVRRKISAARREHPRGVLYLRDWGEDQVSVSQPGL